MPLNERQQDMVELRKLLRGRIGERVTAAQVLPFIKNALEEIQAGRPYGFQESKKYQISEEMRERLESRMSEYSANLVSTMIDMFQIQMVREMRRIMTIALRNYDPATGTIDEESLKAINSPLPSQIESLNPLGWRPKR